MIMQWNDTQNLSLLCRSFHGLWLVDTSTGSCGEYSPKTLTLLDEKHYDQWLILLARGMQRKDTASFFASMDLKLVCARLDSGLERYTVYYRLAEGSEWELSLFYLEHGGNTLAVTKRALPADHPGPLETANELVRANTRLDFLVNHVVENFVEVEVRTGRCSMLHGSNGMKSFPTLKEQVAWWAENLIAPEEQASYRAEYELDRLVATLRANNGYSTSIYTTSQAEHKGTLSITSQLFRPQFDSNEEYIYAYSIDISQYKEQEQRNKQLVDISQQLLALSQTEHLTGLYNRTAAEKFIVEHIQDCKQELAGTLLLIDIDHFKEFNDKYGHQVGDFVLKFLSKSMQDIFRSDDILCRWGGDEFMVFMRDVNRPRDVESRVQRLRARMQQCKRNGTHLHVTVSIGGTAASRGSKLKSLFEQCDQMLYHVKKWGRNDFLLFQAPEETKSEDEQMS